MRFISGIIVGLVLAGAGSQLDNHVVSLAGAEFVPFLYIDGTQELIRVEADEGKTFVRLSDAGIPRDAWSARFFEFAVIDTVEINVAAIAANSPQARLCFNVTCAPITSFVAHEKD